jgi:hypothetical protein
MSAGGVMRLTILIYLLSSIDVSATVLADRCFVVHGRLEQSNGVPSFRIWRVGTKRVLGVFDCKGRDESPLAIPPYVKKLAGEYVSNPVFGDFEVCPLTKEHRGWMQMVCIESATHLVLAN